LPLAKLDEMAKADKARTKRTDLKKASFAMVEVRR
jgi:hypothetical protein